MTSATAMSITTRSPVNACALRRSGFTPHIVLNYRAVSDQSVAGIVENVEDVRKLL